MTSRLATFVDNVTIYLPRSGEYITPPGVDLQRSAGSASGLMWLQMDLPRVAARDKLNILWGPAHRLPILLPSAIRGVLTIHDLVWVHAPRTMRTRTWLGERLLMAPSIRRADAIVTDSKSTTADLTEKFKLTGKQVSTVYPGTTFLPRSSRGASAVVALDLGQKFALFVGTLEPRKNLPRILDAYAALPFSVREKCTLVITGGAGWGGENLGSLISARGIAANVRLLGYVDNDILAELYARCAFLVMPSIYEGFGFPVLEANAHGAPALISSHASLPEVGGDASLVVNPLDTAAISGGMRRLIEDDPFRMKLASHAVANSSRFDWNASAMQLLKVFEGKVVGG